MLGYEIPEYAEKAVDLARFLPQIWHVIHFLGFSFSETELVFTMGSSQNVTGLGLLAKFDKLSAVTRGRAGRLGRGRVGE